MCCLSIMRHCSSSRRWQGRLRPFRILAFILCTGTTAEGAEESGQPGVSGYCDYVESAAASGVARQMAPSLFVSGGVLTNSEAIDLSGRYDSMSTLLRLQAGLSYSLADLTEALAIRARAHSECALYRQQSELFAFLVRYDEADSLAGTRARMGVLNEALPKAEEILASQRDLVLEHHATVEELNATSVRLDALRAEIGSSRMRAAAAERKHTVSERGVRDIMRIYRDAIEQVASSESRVRTSRNFDLSLRGGYDRVFGVRDGVPLFATLTLTIHPFAIFRQPPLERQAHRGRFEWASLGVEGIHDRVSVLLSRMQTTLEAQRRRRADAKLLLADLEARYKAVEQLAGDSVRAYRDYLWFDLTKMRAELAYLDAQVEELQTLLGPNQQ